MVGKARVIGALVVASLVLASAVGAEAATKKKVVKRTTRTVTLTYTGGCTIEAWDGGSGVASRPGACSSAGAADWTLAAKKGERYLTIKAVDASGLSVPGDIWVQGSGLLSTEYQFCGATKDFKLPAPSFDLALDSVGAVRSCPGLATSGKITVVFSNLP